MAFNDHFSTLSRVYADFRPTYPAALAEFLAGIAPGRALAWDCGTGQGQAARLLAPWFERVVATDASPQQIAQATPIDRVTFAVAPAQASGLPDGSCDLVTVAQAVHWFDRPAFYAEARRVLRPGGVLAVWCYFHAETGVPAIDRCVHAFQFDRVGRYWPPGRELVDARYETLDFPFTRIETPAFHVAARWTRDQLVGYVSSWSAVARCRAAEGADPLPAFVSDLSVGWPDASSVHEVRWPMYLLVGRV
jgi:SAM-dependent methyltransferase